MKKQMGSFESASHLLSVSSWPFSSPGGSVSVGEDGRLQQPADQNYHESGVWEHTLVSQGRAKHRQVSFCELKTNWSTKNII